MARDKKDQSESIQIQTEVIEKIGALEQLRRASLATSRTGKHAENAKIEMALFALHNLSLKLADLEIDGAVGEIKALL